MSYRIHDVSRETGDNVSRETCWYMPSNRRKIGDKGENLAAQYLASKGYRIIERNYLKPWGEIDIVSSLRNRIIFCEVKTRDYRNESAFLPEASVSKNKASRLKKTCETYLTERRIPQDIEWQIDLIYVSNDTVTGKSKMSHYENIVWGHRY